ncbi:hypothetical protein ACTXP8_26835, partial [Klebsiella pneumoniae]|uniref:hypothetical protein n=1 Tax=Klebsiella pneumoniae TaxID=573 RepID=UPI003FCF90BC
DDRLKKCSVVLLVGWMKVFCCRVEKKRRQGDAPCLRKKSRTIQRETTQQGVFSGRYHAAFR